MERAAYQSLLNWKTSSIRKPLIVQGARQVGKTYLVQMFAKREYSNLVYLNFEENSELKNLFDGDLNPDKLMQNISAFTATHINADSTLLFFDEIQVCPRALTSLKYFNEQAPQYHIVAAGSLLGVSVGKTSSFPVGKVQFLQLYPLSFFEFLESIDEHLLVSEIIAKNHIEEIPEALHKKIFDLLKLYFFIGGMPEAVAQYIESKDLQIARAIQKDIIKAYESDFSKYTTATEAIRVSEIWQSIPSQLARENKKFKYSEIKKGARASHFESSVEWLRSAGLLYISRCITTAKLPLFGFSDNNKFKVYMIDNGLLGAMLNIQSKDIVSGDKLFSDYNGAFTENFIASQLVQKTEGILYYWLSDGVAEVDFLVQHDQMIFPLEVKSGLKRNIKSLWIYDQKYNPSNIIRTSPRNFERNGKFINIPLYAVGVFPEILTCV